MSRWQAAGLHFIISIVVIGAAILACLLSWYPLGLYKISGLNKILALILSIDLTIGPLLTLFLYRKKKPNLKFDLSAIATIQALFLSYGLHTAWSGRPIFLVGTPEVFTLVFANEIDAEDIKKASQKKWPRLSFGGPMLVGVKPPSDRREKSKIIEELMSGGAGMERTPKYYQPFSEVSNQILFNATQMQKGSFLRENLDASVLTFPIVSIRGEGILVIDDTNASPLDVLTHISTVE